MKYILIILFFTVIGLISYGFYSVDLNPEKGNLIIGIGVVLTAFVLMPLFIYNRYKDKDMKSFQFKNFKEELEKFHEKNQEKDF
jgi:uncharacterized membrane protein (DUF485 family)